MYYRQRHYLIDKGPSSQSYDFSSSHVWMWELDHKESCVAKNWCFWTMVLKKTLENPLDTWRSNQSILKEISPEYSLEGLLLNVLPPDAKSWFIWKDPDAGKDWRQEKGTTEDEMVGWHHQLDGREFEWTPGFGDGREVWFAAVLSWTWQSDWTELTHACQSCSSPHSSWKL